MPYRLRIADLLQAWRNAITRTGTTAPDSQARSDADADERDAHWAYEDESIAQQTAHGSPETTRHMLNRLTERSDELQRETAEKVEPTRPERTDEDDRREA
jgi:Ca2+-binding RTX toxin-like protein